MKILMFDTETTDLNGYAIEACFLLYDTERHKIDDFFVGAFNPLCRCAPEVVEKFFIDEDALKRLEPFEKFAHKIEALINEAHVICAHNVSFDLGVLHREFGRIGKILTIDPKRYFERNAFCTMKEAKYYAEFDRWPKLEILAPTVAVQKAKKLTNLLLNKTQYNPDSIRTRHIDYHNAVFDTCVLTYTFAYFYKTNSIFREIVEKASQRPKTEVKKNIKFLISEMLEKQNFDALFNTLKSPDINLVLTRKGQHQPLLPDKPDEKRKILFRDRLYVVWKDEDGWKRDRLSSSLINNYYQFSKFCKSRGLTTTVPSLFERTV